ncbi:MAG: tetratricopeptide repeat protein [Candidatus Kaiserbacteria bacterium]|nr:tetratricopeptide repeat protein [Candidatus Kaiserbacteria bacterium]
MLHKLTDNVFRGYWPYVIICTVGVLLYAKSFAFGFTYLDDHVLILNNVATLENFWYIFGAFVHGVFPAAQDTSLYYRPLLTISFMPEAMIGGTIPSFYHFINVVLHLISACLVYLFFIKLKYSKRISLLAGLIFVTHPVFVQAVAWIPGRNDPLLAIFVLLSFIYFLDFIEEEKRKSVVYSVFFFAFALFTKETSVVLPALCLLYLWARKALKKSTLLQFSVGWLSAIVVWFPIRSFVMSDQTQTPFLGMISSFVTNVPGTVQMVGKIFFPLNLSVLPVLRDTTYLWGYIAIAIIVGLVVWQLKDKKAFIHSYRMMLFGAGWFLLFLWPSFIISDPSGSTYFLEHRLYVPLIGLFILVAESSAGRSLNVMSRKLFVSLSLLVLILFSCITFVHEDVFSNRLMFWQSAAVHSPHSSLANKNLGAMYYLDQNYPLAEIYTQKALALNPEEPMAHNNLGLIDAARGKFDDAKKEYFKELSINLFYDSAHYNLGLLYYQMGDFRNARKQWEQTLMINPNYDGAPQALQELNREGK